MTPRILLCAIIGCALGAFNLVGIDIVVAVFLVDVAFAKLFLKDSPLMSFVPFAACLVSWTAVSSLIK